MNNPFDVIEARLSNIENLLLDIKHNPKMPELPDRMSLEDICNDFQFTKPFIYKETSHGTMPCSRFGNRLVFSRKEVIQWMTSRTVRKQSPTEIAAKHLQRAAKKKIR